MLKTGIVLMIFVYIIRALSTDSLRAL